MSSQLGGRENQAGVSELLRFYGPAAMAALAGGVLLAHLSSPCTDVWQEHTIQIWHKFPSKNEGMFLVTGKPGSLSRNLVI